MPSFPTHQQHINISTTYQITKLFCSLICVILTIHKQQKPILNSIIINCREKIYKFFYLKLLTKFFWCFYIKRNVWKTHFRHKSNTNQKNFLLKKYFFYFNVFLFFQTFQFVPLENSSIIFMSV